MKLAVIGTGKIISEALLAMAQVKDIELSAIFGRAHSKDKAEAFAREYGIPSVYTDYEELLETSEADTVYIGLVNSVHYEYAKKALLFNKNVILEKPFCSTFRESKELADLAEQNHCYIFEAITPRHSLVYEKMKELLPSLGDIHLVLANYSQYSSRYDKYKNGEVLPAFDPQLSGGTLYDLGIYNISLLYGLLGISEEVVYYPNKGFNGIDTSGILLARYPKFLASLTAAKDSDSECFFSVQGDKGWLRMAGKPNEMKKLEIFLNGELATYEPQLEVNRMVREFKDFARILLEDKYEEMRQDLKYTLAVSEMMEKARKAAGIVFGVDEGPN